MEARIRTAADSILEALGTQREAGAPKLIKKKREADGSERVGKKRRATEKTLGSTPAPATQEAKVEARPIDQLAKSVGVQPEYIDVFGKSKQVPEEILRGVLSSMGISAGTDDELKAAIAAREDASWKRTLAPVQVVRAKSAIAIDVNVPTDTAHQRLVWKVIEEDGRVHSGRFSTANLKSSGAREIEGSSISRFSLPISKPLGTGYHQVVVETAEGTELGRTQLIVTPRSCYQPPKLKGDKKLWGLGVQLYSLRSERNWGIGDFTDLKNLAPACALAGCNVIGLNPIHALFGYEPQRCSPYSPSTRLFVNPIYLDVESVAGFKESNAARDLVRSEGFQLRLQQLRDTELVDHASVYRAKLEVLGLAYDAFRDGPTGHESFRAYQKEKGEALEKYAIFEALQEHFAAAQPMAPHWGGWPEAYRDPSSKEVKEFASAHADRVQFFAYLQWQADVQLKGVQSEGKRRGLDIGLYRDLAVGLDRYGSDTWTAKDGVAMGASVGAPADLGNPKPQNWGLPPPLPDAMKDAAYQPFIEELRQNMRHAGALRLDHVMRLYRLFVLPPGENVQDGAYVHYPFDELLGIVALESQRNKCLVIGEDLGTVPEGFREKMNERGVYSYRVMSFEREEGGLLMKPEKYPEQAAVVWANHDLPTLAGYWRGNDLSWRLMLGQMGSPAAFWRSMGERTNDRKNIVNSLIREDLIEGGARRRSHLVNQNELPEEVNQATHAYLDRTPSKLLMVQPEEILAEPEQANLPGTLNEHPNFRRKMSVTIDQLTDHPRFRQMSKTLRDRA